MLRGDYATYPSERQAGIVRWVQSTPRSDALRSFDGSVVADRWRPSSVWEDLGITDPWPRLAVLAVTLERTACFGDCPTYIATIAEDDRAERSGIADVPLLGDHTLDIGPGVFAMLADLVEELGCFQWKERDILLPEMFRLLC